MNKTIRQKMIDSGKSSGFQSPCTSAVLSSFGINKSEYRYSQTMNDVIRILRRKGYIVRSRGSKYKGKTIGSIRNKLYIEKSVYMIQVDHHVLTLGHEGNTLVDTFPMKRDRRKVKGIWIIRKGI